MMQYEIQIGESIDFSTGFKKPKTSIIISEDQKQLIDHFANTRKDENLNTIYRLNDCEFRVVPYFVHDGTRG